MENMTILQLQEKFGDKLQNSKRPELTMNRLAIYHSEHLKGTRCVFVKFYEDYNYVRSMDNYPDLKMFTGCFNLIECIYYIDVDHSVKEGECQPAIHKMDPAIHKVSDASNNLDKVQNIVDTAFKTANNEASHLLIEARGYLADVLEDSDNTTIESQQKENILTIAEFNNKYVGRIGKVIMITKQTDLEKLLIDITHDADSGKLIWYKKPDKNKMFRLVNPRQIDSKDLGNAEKILVILHKDITKDDVFQSDDLSKKLWDMQLHESMMIGKNTNVTRVPGGWLYATSHKNSNGAIINVTETFVPLNNEFI